MAEEVRLDVLGPIRATRDHEPVVLRGATGRTIAACLALAGGRTVSVDRLAQALWDDEPPPSAPNVIQSAISRLRSGLGASAVIREGEGYRIDPAVVSTDIDDLAQLTKAASTAEAPADAAALLEQALALWRGESLAGVAATTAWIPERVRLDEQRATLGERRFLERLDAGDGDAVVADLHAEARSAPLRETTHLLLMRALGESGRTAEALRVATAFRRRLADETGLEPSAELTAAEKLLLDIPAARSASTAAEPAPRAAVPVRSKRAWVPPDNEFVGRETTVSTLLERLAERRLVTILGAGGIGKTRLAMELVARLTAAEEGGAIEVVVVELAAVGATGDIAPTIAGELGLESTGEDLVASLAERLDLFAGLLVLDNAEHIRTQARDLADQLLRRAPSLRILVTSRRRLGLAEEHVVRLDPLPLPAVALPGGDPPGADEPSVRLFLDRLDRAHADAATPTIGGDRAEPDAATLAAALDICHATAGIPLAIELAASRVALLGLEGLRRRLAASFDILSLPGSDTRRQATLDSTIQWSVELLDPATITVFEELSVFPDRFALADAEAVVAGDVLGALAELVDSSLVTTESATSSVRYRMLEPIRQHARRRLDAAGSRTSEVLDAHAGWALSLGERMEAWWTGDEALRSARELARRRADLVAALRHLSETGRSDDVDRLARQIGMVLIEHPDMGFSTLIPAITGASLDGAVARAVIGSAIGRPRPEELGDLHGALAHIDPADPRRHFLRFAFVPAQQYQGDIEGAVATCRTMLADAETPLRLRVLAVAMWGLAEGLVGRFAEAQKVLDSHEEILGLSEVGGFVAYVRAEVAAGTDVEAAVRHVTRAMALSADAPTSFVAASAKVLRLSLLVHGGDLDGACDLARTLTPELLAAGTVPHAWRALRALSHVLVANGHYETAARVHVTADHDPRAPVVLGHWNEMVTRQWVRICDELGDERIADIRAAGTIVTIGSLWAEVEAALR